MFCENHRKFVSFGGKCPFACNHCYTYSDEYVFSGFNNIEDIATSIKKTNPKIVYVSGHRENFVDPDEGLLLCETIFKYNNVDLLITTRNIFNDNQLIRLQHLSHKMKKDGHDLFVCSSIVATESYKKLEPNYRIPTPKERMDFLKNVFNMGIYTILTIRPLCPSTFIPIEEPLDIIDYCYKYSSAILSSGIVVDDSIISRLVSFPLYKSNGKKALMECLKNDMLVDYVNVDEELYAIKKRCEDYKKELFFHSLEAINYLKA